MCILANEKARFIYSVVKELMADEDGSCKHCKKQEKIIYVTNIFPHFQQSFLLFCAPPGWVSGERVGLMTWWL